MNVDDTLRYMGDVADRIVAVADLDEMSRQDVQFDRHVGAVDLAIYDAVMGARKPLPEDLLAEVRAGLEQDWFDDIATADLRRLLTDAKTA